MEKVGVLTMEEEPVNLLTLELAEGTIDAEHTPEVVKTAEAFVRGVWHDYTEGAIICKCIDGRNCVHSLKGPNSAGGSLSLLVADDLTTRRFISVNESTAAGMTNLATHLTEAGLPVGVHADTHAEGEKSGCGANDKLSPIYAMMVKNAEAIRGLAEAILGLPIPQDIHNMIMGNATERVVFSTGIEVKEAAIAVASEKASETLEGEHQEIVAVINKVVGTTLNRDEAEVATGGKYQAFNVDAWAFEASAKAIAADKDDDMEVQAKIIALTYYNLATALVLCGPRMLVGIRE